MKHSHFFLCVFLSSFFSIPYFFHFVFSQILLLFFLCLYFFYLFFLVSHLMFLINIWYLLLFFPLTIPFSLIFKSQFTDKSSQEKIWKDHLTPFIFCLHIFKKWAFSDLSSGPLDISWKAWKLPLKNKILSRVYSFPSWLTICNLPYSRANQ